MKLKIENVAKIEYAEIEMNGITIIAGKNNTGKSTIGKVIFSLFNSLSNIEARLKQQKEQLIYKELKYKLDNISRDTNDADYYSVPAITMHSCARELCECDSGEEQRQIIRRLFKRASWFEMQAMEEAVARIDTDISEIKNLPMDRLMKSVVSTYFSRIFYGNVCNVSRREAKARIEATIKERKVALTFLNEACREFEQEIKVLSRAFYLDNPFILNRLNSGGANDEMERVLLRGLRSERDAMEDAVQYSIISEKIQNVMRLLNSVTGGSVSMDESREYLFQEQGADAPLNVGNLSAGLKSFIIIKLLLENHSLRERDVLILDEPEIHLHPEWQMKYAEIIVLLQKEFDLTVILTTHSSHFLEALQLYARIHKQEKKCNYYLTEQSDYGCVLKDMTDDITQIYSQLVDPSIILNKMRYKVEETEDE